MEQRRTTIRRSLTVSLSARGEILRAEAQEADPPAKDRAGTEGGSTEENAGQGVLRIHIRKGRTRREDGSARLFFGPSARPKLADLSGATKSDFGCGPWVQEPLGPETARPEPGGLASLGVRIQRAFRSMFA